MTDETTNVPESLPVPAGDSFGFVPGSTSGSLPLKSEKHEAYCRHRALLETKINAYRAAGYESQDDHAARGNANKLERRADVKDRIAWLTRDEESLLRQKRRKLEERLWYIHDLDPTIAWQTEERELRDKKGKVIEDQDGKPVTFKVSRPKMIRDLPDEAKACIETIALNDAGIAVPKFYSALQANQELRKFLNIGNLSREDGDVARLSDAELVAQLAEQARALGIQIDLSYRLGRE